MILERDTTDTTMSPSRRGSVRVEPIIQTVLDLCRNKKTGVLVIDLKGRRREIVLRQGQVWGVRVDQMSESITAKLQLSDAVMSSVLIEVVERGTLFRVALARILADSELSLKLKQIHQTRLVDVFGWEDGEFHWFEGERFAEGAQDPLDVHQAVLEAVEAQGVRPAQDLLRAKRHRPLKKTEQFDSLRKLAPAAFKEGSVASLLADKPRSFFDLVTSGIEPDRAAKQVRTILLLGAVEFEKGSDPKGKEELPPYVTRLASRAKEEPDASAKITLTRRVDEAKRLLQELQGKPRDAKLLTGLRIILRDAELWDGYFEIVEREREVLEQNREYKAQLALAREVSTSWEKKLLRVDEAIRGYMTALSLDPEEPTTRGKYRELLLDAGESEWVLQLDEEQIKATSQENKRFLLFLTQSKQLWERGVATETVRARLLQAQQLRADDPELNEFLVKIESKEQDPETRARAVKRLMRMAELASTPPRRELDKALVLVDKARVLDPGNLEVLELAERFSRAKADHESTAEILLEALNHSKDPKQRAELRRKLAQLPLGAARTREFLEAILYEKSSPDEIRVEALASLRSLLGRSGEQARFAFFLEEELTRNQGTPKAAQYALELAQLYARSLEDPAKAVSILESALLHEPEQVEVVNALRSLGRAAGWASVARLLARSAFEGRWRDPRDPNRIKRLEEAAKMMEERVLDPARASALWRRLDELDPGATQSREAVRRIEAKMSLQQEVLQAKEREVEASPDPNIKANALKKLAVVYYEQAHDAARAIGAYARAWEIIPGDQEVIAKLEALYQEVQDWEGVARVLYRRLANATEAKERYEILWRYAQVCEERIGRPDAAASALSEILVEHPEDAFALARLEWLYYRIGDFDSYLGARARHAALVQDPIERGAIYAQMAEICEINIGDRERAIELWRWTLEVRPSDWRARFALQRLFAHLGRFDELCALYEQWASEKKPASPRRLGLLRMSAAVSKDRLRDPARELRYLQLISQEDPEDGDTLSRITEIAYSQGNAALWMDAGRQMLSCRSARQGWGMRLREVGLAIAKALEAKTQDAEARQLLGSLVHGPCAGDYAVLEAFARIELKSGDALNAIWAKERSLRKAPDEKRVELCLEIVELWDKASPNHAGKLVALKRLSEMFPHDPKLAELFCEAYANQGEWARVLELSNKRLLLLEDPQERVRLLHYLAKVEEEFLGDPDSSLSTLRRAFEEHPEVPDTFAVLSSTLQQRARWRDLIELYRGAARRFETPEAVRLLHEAARLEEDTCQDPEAALTLLRDTFEAYPESEVARSVLLSSLDRLGKFEELIKSYVKMAERSGLPQRVTLLLKAASLYVEKLSDREGELLIIQRTYRDHPQDPRTLPALVDVLTQLSHWEELIVVYEGIAQRAPNETVLLEAIEKIAAICKDQLKDLKRAFLVKRKKLKLDRRDDMTLSELEELAYEAQAHDELCALYTDLTTHAPHPTWKAAYLSRRAKVREDWQGDQDNALKSYFLAFQQTPDDDELLDELKRLGEETSEREPLFKAYMMRRASTKDIAERRRYTLLAAKVAEDGLLDPEKAFDLQLEALRMQPDDAQCREALRGLATEISELQDDPIPIWQKLGEAFLSIAQQLNPKERIVYLYEIAQIQNDVMRQPEAALTTLEAALVLSPRIAETAERIETYARGAGALLRAIATFIKEAEASDENETVCPLLARSAKLREELGDVSGSVDLWRQVRSLAPNDNAPLAQIESLLQKSGKYEELIQHHETLAAVLKPGPARRERYMAIAHILEDFLSKPRDAIAAYQRILQADPKDQDVLAALTRLYEKLGEWRKLIDLLEKKSQSNPKDAAAVQRRIGEIFAERLQLPKNATTAYEAAAQQEPTDRISRQALAGLYERQQRWQDAVRTLSELVKLTPGVEAVTFLIRCAELCTTKLKDLSGAKQALEDALSRGPSADAEREIKNRLGQLGRPNESA